MSALLFIGVDGAATAGDGLPATVAADNNSLKVRNTLQRGLRTLRAIRQRHEAGRKAHPGSRCYSVQVALDDGDIAWITAVIEALETGAAAGAAQTNSAPRVALFSKRL